MSYNGWKNKETWLVNLWLGDFFSSLKEDGVEITTDLIESEVEEQCDVAPGFVQDMMNCVLGEIDYHEIAAHYQDEEGDEEE